MHATGWSSKASSREKRARNIPVDLVFNLRGSLSDIPVLCLGTSWIFLKHLTHETAVRTFLKMQEQEPEPPLPEPNSTREARPRLLNEFDAVVRDHWTSVYRFLYCTTGNAHDAEDLTQETFLRAWNRLDSFRPGSGMKPWLLRIAANAAHDVRRRRGRVTFTALEYDPVGGRSARNIESNEPSRRSYWPPPSNNSRK